MSAERLREDWPMGFAVLECLRKYPDLTPAAIRVFIEVYAEPETPRTQTQLAKTLGLGRKGVIGATRQLLDRNLIQYEGARLRVVNLIKCL